MDTHPRYGGDPVQQNGDEHTGWKIQISRSGEGGGRAQSDRGAMMYKTSKTGVISCECGGMTFGVIRDPISEEVKLICRNRMRPCGAIWSVMQ